MKDLDFDELDKAVNSLMEKAPKDTPPPAKETETVVTLPDAAAPEVEAPKPVAEPAAPEKKEETPSSATPPVAVKRSGRFMDVVHPSSDMRAPSRPASRTGTTLKPMNDVDTSAPTPPPASMLPTPDSLPIAGSDETLASNDPTTAPSVPLETPEKPAAAGWPDPIEMHEASTAQPTSPDSDSNQESTEKDDVAPSVGSPFLADAKVEKRPLGGLASPVSLEEKDDLAANPAPEDAKKEDTPPSRTEPIPAELGSDVLAIEAGKDNPGSSDDEKKEDVPQLEGGTTEPAPQPAGPTSIAQQYKVQESSGDSSHTALYDSAVDSHALTHPAKKKPGWPVVVGIIVLVLLGAGAGAFVYFSGML